MDELNRHLNVKSYPSIFSKSMTSLRMHMGINSSSGNMISSFNSGGYTSILGKKKADDKYSIMVVDRDLFLLHKTYKKQIQSNKMGSIIGKDKMFSKSTSMMSFYNKSKNS